MSVLERALGGPEIEVTAKATRRRFTLEYKRKIVREADKCKTPGAIGALLRREGLYSSHLTTWRAARERGALTGAPKKRAPVPSLPDPRDKKLAEQEREIARWMAPAEVAAWLLGAGQSLASGRTMYPVSAAHEEARGRRHQRGHPGCAAPELLARRPNELWSWDITKLLGPAKWTYFYLYVMLDVFSRYVVGWMVAHGESATLAETFIRETCDRQGIGRAQLPIHADRGPAMISKSVAFLLADLRVTKTHSRPHVSNDNPYSEAQFKTLKYRPAFPDRFGSIQDARAHCQVFFPWYNTDHHHRGLGLLM